MLEIQNRSECEDKRSECVLTSLTQSLSLRQLSSSYLSPLHALLGPPSSPSTSSMEFVRLHSVPNVCTQCGMEQEPITKVLRIVIIGSK